MDYIIITARATKNINNLLEYVYRVVNNIRMLRTEPTVNFLTMLINWWNTPCFFSSVDKFVLELLHNFKIVTIIAHDKFHMHTWNRAIIIHIIMSCCWFHHGQYLKGLDVRWMRCEDGESCCSAHLANLAVLPCLACRDWTGTPLLVF